jgi:hypothetical protein
MTAYRQQALACAAALLGARRRGRGWFVRVDRGLYALYSPHCRSLSSHRRCAACTS